MPDPASFKVTLDRTSELTEALRKLALSKVMVGIPEDTATRTGGELVNNATLGYIHEHGSPINNVPPRPWLQPGVAGSKDQWSEYLKQAGQLALEGKTASVDKALQAAGITAVSAVKARITAGIPPPLAPATVAARRRRSKGSSYRRKASTSSDVTPLIDTAQMLNSITYVIRKGK